MKWQNWRRNEILLSSWWWCEGTVTQINSAFADLKPPCWSKAKPTICRLDHCKVKRVMQPNDNSFWYHRREIDEDDENSLRKWLFLFFPRQSVRVDVDFVSDPLRRCEALQAFGALAVPCRHLHNARQVIFYCNFGQMILEEMDLIL